MLISGKCDKMWEENDIEKLLCERMLFCNLISRSIDRCNVETLTATQNCFKFDNTFTISSHCISWHVIQVQYIWAELVINTPDLHELWMLKFHSIHKNILLCFFVSFLKLVDNLAVASLGVTRAPMVYCW